MDGINVRGRRAVFETTVCWSEDGLSGIVLRKYARTISHSAVPMLVSVEQPPHEISRFNGIALQDGTIAHEDLSVGRKEPVMVYQSAVERKLEEPLKRHSMDVQLRITLCRGHSEPKEGMSAQPTAIVANGCIGKIGSFVSNGYVSPAILAQ